jgi:hypothetical protein
MQNTTLWRPDTCGCEIEYTWNTDEPAETRTHSLATLKACSIHKDLGLQDNATESYEKVKEENERKNLVFKHVVETIPEFTTIDSEGNKKQAVDAYLWSFDADRNLTFALTKGSQQKKDEVATKVQTDFGDKVVVKTESEVKALKEHK